MRKQHFSSGINKRSLDVIERAAFFVTLDDEEQGMRGDDPVGNLDRYAKSLLHGKCYDRCGDYSGEGGHESDVCIIRNSQVINSAAKTNTHDKYTDASHLGSTNICG